MIQHDSIRVAATKFCSAHTVYRTWALIAGTGCWVCVRAVRFDLPESDEVNA